MEAAGLIRSGRGEGTISMKRILVFLFMAPTSACLAFALIYSCTSLLSELDLAMACVLVLWQLPLPLWMVAAAIDGYSASTLPISLRAPLMAIFGAVATVGLLHALGRIVSLHWWLMPPSTFMPFAIGGAVVMGACSASSHDYGVRQQQEAQGPIGPANP